MGFNLSALHHLVKARDVVLRIHTPCHNVGDELDINEAVELAELTTHSIMVKLARVQLPFNLAHWSLGRKEQ